MGGCACGIIEASYDNERDAANYARMAREYRADAERRLKQAERFEEKAKRLNNGGEECEACEGVGVFPDFMGDGRTEWEPCRECDGFGVTRALTCGDHSDISAADMKDSENELFLWSIPFESTFYPFYNSLMRDQPWGAVIADPSQSALKLNAVRDKLPANTDKWIARHWAWKCVW